MALRASSADVLEMEGHLVSFAPFEEPRGSKHLKVVVSHLVVRDDEHAPVAATVRVRAGARCSWAKGQSVAVHAGGVGEWRCRPRAVARGAGEGVCVPSPAQRQAQPGRRR